MSAWAGIFIILAAALVGIIATLLAKQEPGDILGALILLGTIAAGFGMHYRSAYLVIPAPALLYVVAALATGYIHDRSGDSSHAVLAIHAAEWVGAGFLWMSAGTIAAIVIAGGRWLWVSRSTLLNRGAPVAGGPRPAPGRPNGRPPGRYQETAGKPRPDRQDPRPSPEYRETPAGRSEPAAGRRETAAGSTSAYPRSGPPPLPPSPAGRPSARPPEPTARPAAPPASGSGPEDPFRRYYDDGETWR